MLYLIRSYGEAGKSILKIGYTNNLEKRMYQYKSTNPFFSLIGSREGTEIDERKFHIYLKLKGYKADFLDEWFLDTTEVLDSFFNSLKNIDDYIWKHRTEVWETKSDFYNNNKKDKSVLFKLYEEYREIYKPDFDLLERWYLYSFDKSNIILIDRDYPSEVLEFLKNFLNISEFTSRLKLYCEFSDLHPEFKGFLEKGVRDKLYQKYYDYYGTSGCKALGYVKASLEGNLSEEAKLSKEGIELIYNTFKPGEDYLKSEAKRILGEIYRSLDISKTAKASDLGEYFEIKPSKITNPETGKRENGFRLLKRRY